MFLELVFGFLVLVAASYVGTTMALRGFFGRDRYEPPFERSDGPPSDGESPNTDESSDLGASNATDGSDGLED